MRVLFIISDLTFGGAQTQVAEMAREFVRRGDDAAIYTLNSDVPRAPELEGTGVELVVDQKRRKLDPAVLARLRRFIRRWRPDVIHGFLYDGDIYARIAAIGTGIPVLNSERSDNYTISRTQHVAHWLTRSLVDGVVANSRSGSAFAQRLYGYDPAHMHVVWNGVRAEDLERKAQAHADYRTEFFGPGAFRIACLVGAIKPAKDYPLALDTAAALVKRAPEWRVLFIGDQLAKTGATYKVGADSDTGAYKEAVLAQYRGLGLEDRVKFIGERRDALAIVKQCDVLFSTSCREGFPNVVLEAMALGVPVASTDYSDIRHILPHPAQVARERSAEAVARAILRVDALREAIAAEQKRWVREHASIEKATQELERVYLQYVRRDAVTQAA
jgi:glycosyltransferase involved in cell wall biosynthesis